MVCYPAREFDGAGVLDDGNPSSSACWAQPGFIRTIFIVSLP